MVTEMRKREVTQTGGQLAVFLLSMDSVTALSFYNPVLYFMI